MANRDAILSKIKRNLEMRGITVDVDSVSATTGYRYLQVNNITIHYESADIASPMGGVSDAASPFLGIGTANPGNVIIAGLLDADAAIADVLVDEEDLQVLRICSGFANDIKIKAGRTDLSILAADLAVMPGSADFNGLGQ